MPRSRRGGPRQGTPGKAYSNRTDMGQNYNMQKGSPAGGGMQAPGGGMPQLPIYPDELPSLGTPTARPQEPVTSGLNMGDGPGPEAMENYDPRLNETQQLKRWLPILEPLARSPETPDSVRTLVRYIRAS